jgi:sporulation protein YlmC with PRC-barrel domain
MDIPLDTNVQCSDGLCGRSTYVVIDPIIDKVTHIVVRDHRFPHIEYLVPIELIVESTPNSIRLRCKEDELRMLDPFLETHYEEGDLDAPPYDHSQYWLWPYVIPEDEVIPVEYERVPPGELAVRRGARVDATDGHIGVVDEFLIDPASGHISHLILREGHLWGQKDVTIPVSEIDQVEADTVRLELSKDEIEALPAIPVRRSRG